MVLKQVHDTNMRAKGHPERVFSVSAALPSVRLQPLLDPFWMPIFSLSPRCSSVILPTHGHYVTPSLTLLLQERHAEWGGK